MKHILIDFENIQPTSLDSIDDPENTQVWLFLGVHQQKTLPYPLTKSLFRFTSQHVHFVEMQRTGKNALDHYLAFYLGKISEIDHNAQVCILAKDGGYDILVEHLNATHTGLKIQRLSDLQIFNGMKRVMTPRAEPSSARLESSSLVEPLATLAFVENTASENDHALLMSKAYQHIVAEIKTRLESQNFLPSKKNNFLSALQKYFLADLLKGWDNDEQFLFAQKLFTRLINYGLLKIKDDGNTLIYQFSKAQLRENVAKFVLISKPKTLEKLINVLKSHMTLLQMPTNEQTIAQLLQWLEKNSYIYQTDNKISYANSDLAIQPTAQEKIIPINLSATPELFDKTVALLTGKFSQNRPTKQSSLATVLTYQLKLTHQQVQKLIVDLQRGKVLVISKQGKITYHL